MLCYLNRFYYVNMFVVSRVMENHNVICLNWIISGYVFFFFFIFLFTLIQMYMYLLWFYFPNVKYGACCIVGNLMPSRSKLFKVAFKMFCGSMTLTNVCVKGLIKSNNLFEKSYEINKCMYFNTIFRCTFKHVSSVKSLLQVTHLSRYSA